MVRLSDPKKLKNIWSGAGIFVSLHRLIFKERSYEESFGYIGMSVCGVGDAGSDGAQGT